MLMTGMGPAGIIFTTLLVNFRHFLMSAYLSTRIRKTAKKNIFLMAFGVTDEVFSVLSFKKGELSPKFVFILQWSAYSGWVAGTVAGYVLGGFLPEILTKSMGVALYALLLAILLPEMKQSVKVLILTLASGVLNTLLIRLDILPNGWNIIMCILVIALAGSFFITGADKEEQAYE
jgi:predicted branched-subunit amino acid permease